MYTHNMQGDKHKGLLEQFHYGGSRARCVRDYITTDMTGNLCEMYKHILKHFFTMELIQTEQFAAIVNYAFTKVSNTFTATIFN